MGYISILFFWLACLARFSGELFTLNITYGYLADLLWASDKFLPRRRRHQISDRRIPLATLNKRHV